MRFDKSTLDRWTAAADDFLKPAGNTRDDVITGRDAWGVAHRVGITAEAYRDRDVIDAHIQTALERIFPNAVFRDKKRY